jgi:hypothetical protein
MTVYMLAESKTSCSAEIATPSPQLELCSRPCQSLTPSRLNFTQCSRSLLARRHTETMAAMVGKPSGHLSTCKPPQSFLLLSILSTQQLNWEMSQRVQFRAQQLKSHRLSLLHMWLYNAPVRSLVILPKLRCSKQSTPHQTPFMLMRLSLFSKTMSTALLLAVLAELLSTTQS